MASFSLPDGIELVQALTLRQSKFTSVAWSPDGCRLAAGAQDGVIWIWDLTADQVRLAQGHESSVFSVAWSPDGRRLASGSEDDTVRLWDPDGAPFRTLQGHESAVWSVAWSPDGRRLASGSEDDTVRLWDPDGAPLRTLQGHESLVSSVAWSPDGRRLASGSWDKTVRQWDPDGGPLRTLQGHESFVGSVAWSPDGRCLASGSWDKTVRLWDPDGGPLRTLQGHESFVGSVAWSPDGRHLASGSWDKTVRLWDPDGTPLRTLQGHEGEVWSVAWSTDGRRLASGSEGYTVRLWDPDGTPLRTLQGQADSVRSVAWSPDGRRLASGSSDKTVRLWDPDGAPLRTLQGHESLVSSVAWSPGGRRLASGSGDRTVRLWDPDGTPLRTLQGHEGQVTSVAWSPDGRRLASGSSDKTVRLWDPDGAPLRTLQGHESLVSSVAWSPGGRCLACGSEDKTVQLWDPDGGPLRTLQGHERLVLSVAWSPDGRRLASQDSDGKIILWDPDSGDILAREPSVVYRWAGCGVLFLPTGIAERFGDSLVLRKVRFSGDRIATRQYRSAKIVLLGESEVGKSTLAVRLVDDRYEPQSTTHGMKVWPLPDETLHPADKPATGEEREVFLWDLGGQAEYQLIHQLFLHDTRLALFLMDPTRDKDNFTEIADWNARLEAQLQRRGGHATKILIHSKFDRPQTRPVDPAKLDFLISRCGFVEFLRISAADPAAGDGVAKLREVLSRHIDWEKAPPITTLKTVRDVYDAVMAGRQRGDVFLSVRDLRAQFPAVEARDFEHAVRSLSEQGLVVEIDDLGGERILLLRVEEIEQYAGSVLVAVHGNPRGVPAIEESTIFHAGSLSAIAKPLPLHQRHLLVSCVIQLLIEKGICFRKFGQLIFPTEFPKEKPPVTGEFDDPVAVRFDFSGAVRNLYAAVVSRLHDVGHFGQVSLWRFRAQYERDGGICALELEESSGSQAHFVIQFNQECPAERRKEFLDFVSDFLVDEGAKPKFGYALTCQCGTKYPETIIDAALQLGKDTFQCGVCNAVHDLRRAPSPREREPGVRREGRPRAAVTARVAPPIQETRRPLGILHLSDLHFKKDDTVDAVFGPLREDLLNFSAVDLGFVVISGDLTDRGNPEGFDRAAEFMRRLHAETGVPLGRFVICPGNHDVQNHDSLFTLRSKPEPEDEIVSKLDEEAYRVRVKAEYPKRFEKFCLTYNQLFDYDLRTGLPELSREMLFPEQRVQFVALNTAYRIDKYRPKESAIDSVAFSRTLEQADKKVATAKLDRAVLRIAVWHHAVLGRWSMADPGPFVQRLAQGRYSLVLHGDVHETRAQNLRPLQEGALRCWRWFSTRPGFGPAGGNGQSLQLH